RPSSVLKRLNSIECGMSPNEESDEPRIASMARFSAFIVAGAFASHLILRKRRNQVPVIAKVLYQKNCSQVIPRRDKAVIRMSYESQVMVGRVAADPQNDSSGHT